MDQAEHTNLQQLIALHFTPGTTGTKDSKDRSTTDIFAILDEHAPGLFSPGEVYTTLKATGYESRLVGDEIVWSVAAPAG